MLQLNPKWGAIAVAVVALFGYWWWLTSSLDEYRALSQKQAQQINALQASLAQTKSQLTAEREAIQKQIALEQAERIKADEDITAIKTALYAQDCAAVPLPADTLKRLQR